MVTVLAAWVAMEVGDGYQTHDHLLRAITAEVVTGTIAPSTT